MTAMPVTHRGTTNRNVRGSSTDRRRRRDWIVQTYRANVDVLVDAAGQVVAEVPLGEGVPATRCYRCGTLLTAETLTVDRIKPGILGGKYGTPLRDAREGRTNVRPACGGGNSSTGGVLGAARRLGGGA